MIWFGNLTAQAKFNLARLVKIVMKTIGKKEHQSFESLYKQSVLREPHQILVEALHIEYELLPSERFASHNSKKKIKIRTESLQYTSQKFLNINIF